MRMKNIQAAISHSRHVLSAVVPIALAVAVILRWPVEPVGRWTGALLEFFGLLVAVNAIADTRRTFNLQSVSEWLGELVNKLQGKVSAHAVGGRIEITARSMTGAISGGGLLPPGTSTEAQLAHLQRQIEDLRVAHSRLDRDLRDESHLRDKEVRDEARSREEADEKIRTFVREAVAGGVALESVGIVWLLAGLIISAYAGGLPPIGN